MCISLCFTFIMSFYECVQAVNTCYFLWRYVAQGKGILQPHKLIDELDNISGEDQQTLDLKNGPFGEIIKSAQVK